MLKKLAMLAIPGVLVTLAGCSMTKPMDIIEYNDTIVDLQDEAIDIYNNFNDFAIVTELEEEDMNLLEEKRLMAIDEITAIKIDMEAIGPYKNDAEMIDAFVGSLDGLLDVLYSEWDNLIQLRVTWIPMEELPQSDLDRQDVLLDAIDTHINEAFDYSLAAQEKFSESHGYTLIDNEYDEYNYDYAE